MSNQNTANTEKPTHTNRLIHETSPYLLQHAHNPVDWHPWGEEALQKAQAEDKPIFLSIGYSACHWCHVMERESFEDEATARLMNELFINIKVDREERPDLDAIYMDAVQAMTGTGGWPMSVFLTPDGRPFYGGTYFPPTPRHGLPSFQQVLLAVADAYAKRRGDLEQQAERLTAALARSGTIQAQNADLSTALLDRAIQQLGHYFDEHHGGFGSQPKFPQPMSLDFALREHARTGNLDALYMVEFTLEKMAAGGIYDHLGGGFHRYSVDAIWLTPHFEKMLYDNAQLLRTYLNAWRVTGRPLFCQVVEETVDYVLREMTAPAGGFYSTQDADSEGEEGKFFVWTPAEIEAALGQEDAALFNRAFGVTAMGNFEGKNILHRVASTEELARDFELAPAEVEERLTALRRKLFTVRAERVPPARDEKVLTEWNGLMIHALAEVGVALERQDALDAAVRAAHFVLEHMSQEDGRLLRSYKDGQARFNAYLEDYASMVRALIALYESTFEMRWLAEAIRLAKLMIAQFGDPQQGGFFQTGVDHEALVVRRKDFIDNATPSGNSLAADALLRLAVLTGNDEYRQQAIRIFQLMAAAMEQQPTGFGRLLCALSAYLQPSREVVIVGEPEAPATQALLREVWSRYLPTTTLALKRPQEETYFPLFAARTLVEGRPTAYVCENYTCRLPVTEPEALAALLRDGK
ncbi:MAG: thioredoxin domain-containing protein [Caldilineae bacterium]|nr:MAG: thioredoxin domain-containing protein [Caldilineae bacterium]